MRLGIIGRPQSGKAAVFEALTGTPIEPSRRGEPRIASVPLPDDRVGILSEMYRPKKTTHAQVEYFLPGRIGGEGRGDPAIWNAVRSCDALIHVVRNFSGQGFDAPTPVEDFTKLNQDMVFADLVSVTKRIERLELDRSRNRPYDPQELELLHICREMLESERPLRDNMEIASARLLKGFTFVSAKPTLALLNNDDHDGDVPDHGDALPGETCMVIRGRLEAELARMTPEDQRAFLEEFDIPASALDRVVKTSYDLLGLISFFTVGDDEVRAWEIRRGTVALDAAEVIHSDIRKGFIRAEVVAYRDLIDAGSCAECRRRGTVRLEGKNYPVADGDIINFRFSV